MEVSCLLLEMETLSLPSATVSIMDSSGEGEYFFVTTNNNNIELWSLRNCKPELVFVLEGHQSPITRIATGYHALCSLGRDSLLLWQLEDCLHSFGSARPLPSLSCCHSDVTCLVLSDDDVYLAVAVKKIVNIIGIKETDFITINKLFGHTQDVAFASFVPGDHTHLITASDDKTFKVWNVLEGGVVLDSGYISSSPFMGLSLVHDYTAIGTTDGKVRFYSSLSTGRCNVVREIDLKLLINKQLSLGFSEDPLVDRELNLTALLLWPVTTPLNETTPTETTGAQLQDSASFYDDLMSDGLRLLVYSSVGLLLIDVMNNEIISHSHIPGGVANDTSEAGVLSSLNEITQFWNISNDKCLGLVSSSSSLSLFKFTFHDSSTGPLRLSVLSSVPLVGGSPLKAELSPVPPLPKKVVKGVTHQGGAIGSDKPVTFRSTVKSSGYLQSPRMKMFQPAVTKAAVAKRQGPRPPRELSLIANTSITDSRHRGINHLMYNTMMSLTTPPSAAGSCLACCGESSSVYLLKSNDQQNLLQGHDGRVRGIDWSHTHSWLLSCSADKSVCLWSVGGGGGRSDGQCLMRISQKLHNFKEKNEANIPFSSEVSNSLFYYLDKFLLLTVGNTLNMYKYHINPSPPPDIKRYQSKNHYKRVTSLIPDSAHSITAISAINNFYSYIVITAGSNRSLNIVDMNTCKWVWSQDDAHSSRHVHWITQNKGSKTRECVPQSHDLFATSAIGGGVKLWDMRSQSCVRWYTGFINRSLPVRTCFSVCGRYIATGSEENAVVVFDLRYLSAAAKLQCPGPVSSVTYHPSNNGLSCSTLDGSILSFTDN